MLYTIHYKPYYVVFGGPCLCPMGARSEAAPGVLTKAEGVEACTHLARALHHGGDSAASWSSAKAARWEIADVGGDVGTLSWVLSYVN